MSLKSYCEAKNYTRLLREWDSEKNFPLTPETVPHTSRISVWWQCEKSHSWCTQVRSRSGSSTGCPKCREAELLGGRQLHFLSGTRYAAVPPEPQPSPQLPPGPSTNYPQLISSKHP